jgi:hypothetical protein
MVGYNGHAAAQLSGIGSWAWPVISEGVVGGLLRPAQASSRYRRRKPRQHLEPGGAGNYLVLDSGTREHKVHDDVGAAAL